MLVFIDESGDPGFKLDKGSSPFFVASMVIFEDSATALSAQVRLEELQRELKAYPEFKFGKCPVRKRIRFFEEIAELEFVCRAVVVDKRLIYSPALRSVKESFYKFFIRMMIQNDAGILKDAKIVVDGSGDRHFKKQFQGYLRKNVSKEIVKECKLKDSKKDVLVQLADMTAGGIARSYRPEFSDHKTYLKILEKNNQIQNIWNFR